MKPYVDVSVFGQVVVFRTGFALDVSLGVGAHVVGLTIGMTANSDVTLNNSVVGWHVGPVFFNVSHTRAES